MEEKGLVAVDTETNSLNPHEAKLVGISLIPSSFKSFLIAFNQRRNIKGITKILELRIQDI